MIGIDYGVIFIIPITVILVIYFRAIRKKYSNWKVLGIVGILSAIYVNCAIAYAFFPITIIDIPGFSISNNINWEIGVYSSSYFQLFLNILLTYPVGVGARFVTNMRNVSRFFFVCVVSVSIEIIQLIILFAFEPIDIFFDVNDIICNLLGGVLGYMSIFLLNCMCKKSEKTNNENLIGFIKNVCINCANNKKSLGWF